MTARARTRSERVFRALLLFYPRAFRERFADDMAALFADQLRGATGTAGGVATLWRRAVLGVLRTAALERAEALRDASRSLRSEHVMNSLATDLRFAARMLRKSPLFTVIAVVCISLGSGAVATIFSAMNAMVLRPLGGAADATELYRMERKAPASTEGISASYPYYEYLRARARSVDGLVSWGKASLALRAPGGEMGTAVYGSYVSDNFFSVLRVRPLIGRFFVPGEDDAGASQLVVVVSEGFWRAHLGADTSIVGREIAVNGHRFTLVGVAPSEFQGLDAPIQSEAWVPLHTRRLLMPNAAPLDEAGTITLRIAGRVKPGVSPAAVARELSSLTASLKGESSEPTWMARYTDVRLSPLTGLPPDASGPLARFLAILLIAASLVLLIASVNVGAMLSARAIARRRELAVRTALGAAPSRLVRQLLTEILLLFALGAVGGIVIAVAATRALERMPIPAEVQITLRISPDGRVFAFALAVSLLTGIVVGLAPALRAARSDVAARLRDGAAASSARRGLVTSALIVGQLAMSLLLLVGAGLFVRALQRGSRIEPGFDPRGVATAQLDPEAWGYDEARGRAFLGALRQRLAAMPGVTAVSYTTILPLTLRSSVESIHLDDDRSSGPDGVQVHQLQVDADYFSVLRLPLVAGRAIATSDDARGAKVAVVNETFARRFWPRGTALGRTFRYGDDRITVVGVARDAKYASLTESWQGESTPPMVYLPLAQQWRPRVALMVRSELDARALAPAIRDAMRAIDAGVPRPVVMSLADAMSLGLLPQRVAALVTGVLGGIGLLLAAVGLYGVIAWSVGRRAREIGIRMALGARRADVMAMVAREGLRLTALGVTIGLLLAAVATRVIASLLVGVSPLDVLTYATMAGLFVAVALVASWLPARRAAATDPVAVLGAE